MLTRRALVETVLNAVTPDERLVAGLGFLAREVHAVAGGDHTIAFYCLGSMGSVIPLALGLNMARPDLRLLALEGDGSLLSNLGTLVTLVRYGNSQVMVVICDNGRYESTGGQPSQPPGLRIERLCDAAGLCVRTAEDIPSLQQALTSRLGPSTAPTVIVAKTAPTPAAPRVSCEPAVMAAEFQSALPVAPS